jgi:hypothetical protein
MPAMCLSLNLPCGVADRTLTPPTVAPVLTVTANLGSTTAQLEWTASDKTSSSSFIYYLYRNTGSAPTPGVDSPIVSLAGSTLTSEDNVILAAGETYYYIIVPSNSAGDGPASNVVEIILPGI